MARASTSGATVMPGSTDPGRATGPRPTTDPGVDGAILRSAAHLRIEGAPGGLGDIELHLRVRGDVAHIRIDGDVGRAAAANAPELASALASAGLSLGRLETPPVAASSGTSTSGGFGDRRGADPGSAQYQSQPQGQPEPQDRGGPASPQPPPPPRGHREPAGRPPPRGGRVHVEA
jgi:hypothetical protein